MKCLAGIFHRVIYLITPNLVASGGRTGRQAGIEFVPVFMLCMSEFKLYMLLLSSTKNRGDSTGMYCEWNVNILK
jgi:hypothetical protein